MGSGQAISEAPAFPAGDIAPDRELHLLPHSAASPAAAA
jgi:hypothetical protein